jgi:hypothetical protein
LQQAQVILVQASNLAAQVAEVQQTSTVAVPEIAATSTLAQAPVTVPGTSTDSVGAAPAAPAPVVPKMISVSFSVVGQDSFVTITNNIGAAVRVKNLDVGNGTIQGISIGKKYGEGYVYAPTFTDNDGNSFDRLSCTGLGSLGKASEYGGPVDPCVRKDSSSAINELQPGEVMILRYTGTPTGVTYQAGSIVEVDSGNDVAF